MKKNKENSIELVVFNSFIRAIKSDGKYMLFRSGIKNNGIMKAFLRNMRHTDTPFSSASSTEEIVKILEKITNEMVQRNGKGGIKDMDKYEHVTMTINHLLHFFVEANGVSMDKLCALGEEIYSQSCFKLFGDSIEDLDKQKDKEIIAITDAEHLKAKLFQEFINGMQKGKISKDTSFESFIRAHKKSFDNLKTANINPQHGQMLGAAPNNNAFIAEAVRPNDEDLDWFDVDDYI